MKDFYEAWYYLSNHPYFVNPLSSSKSSCFPKALMIEVVKVNPKTTRVELDESKNTKTEIWIETGAWDIETMSSTWDTDLDCGGDTFEEAIIELAGLVKKLK